MDVDVSTELRNWIFLFFRALTLEGIDSSAGIFAGVGLGFGGFIIEAGSSGSWGGCSGVLGSVWLSDDIR